MTRTDTTTTARPDAEHLAIVKNAGSSHFSAVDLSNREVVADIGDGKYPHTVAFHPDGRHALLLYISSAHLEVVDLGTMETVAREEELGTASIGCTLTDDGQQMFVSTGASLPDADEPGIIALSMEGEPPTPRRIGTRVLSRCAGTVIGQDGRLYVGLKTAGQVAALSADSQLAVLDRIDVGDKPHDMYPVPGTDLLAVNNAGESFTSFIDLEDGTVTHAETGENPHGIAFANGPNGRRAYIPAREDERVTAVDLEAVAAGERNTSSFVDVGTTTGFATTTPDSRYLLVDSYDESHVTIIDTTSLSVEARVTVGGEPLHLVVSPDGDECYVGNMDPEYRQITVLDIEPLRDARPEDVSVATRIEGLGKLPSGIFVRQS